jgi:hypothetical protein
MISNLLLLQMSFKPPFVMLKNTKGEERNMILLNNIHTSYNNNKIHNYFKCVYVYGKREPGCDHTPGAYTNMGASPGLV